MNGLSTTVIETPSQFSLAVVIGEFQLWTQAHQQVLAQALQLADHAVMILGSSACSRQLQHPLSANERSEMLVRAWLELGDTTSEVHLLHVKDIYGDDAAWADLVHTEVNNLKRQLGIADSSSIAWLGSQGQHKALSAYFPKWHAIDAPALDFEVKTLLSEFWRSGRWSQSEWIPSSIQQWFSEFTKTPAFQILQSEQNEIDAYKKMWASAPYPPVFVTADAILECAGHLLLIQRKHSPGQGLWANPGGFLDPHETLLQGAIRELQEETAVAVNPEDLIAGLVSVQAFDYPFRSARGRSITHTHYFKLAGQDLPSFQAGDDAAHARWISLEEVATMESVFFEDHFHMIRQMVFAARDKMSQTR